MNNEKAIIGFLGAGGIARSHAYSINSLPFFYNHTPVTELDTVCSATEKSRTEFAERFGFKREAGFEEFVKNKIINTVYILGPNKVHYEHLSKVMNMSSVKRIYIEKPVCSTVEEEIAIAELAGKNNGIKIQVGFQYLFSPAIREALRFWLTGELGLPIHFDLKYYHGDYLKKEYRDKRTNRLTPSPDGGAMADLGSHAISLALAFLGNRLDIKNALQSGNFDDVINESDLFSQISLFDNTTKAAGTLSASRISSGTGDTLGFEIFAERGAIRYSTVTPDYFEYYTEEGRAWIKQFAGSTYKDITAFPSGHVPPGWLRAMVHAHYVFLAGSNQEIFIPDIRHGLEVQRLVRESAQYLTKFRQKNL